MAVKEAKATVTRARGIPKDEAKARSRAKLGESEALRRRIRTRTRTGPGEAPTLRQEGPIGSALEGSKPAAYDPFRNASATRTRS